MAKKKTKKYNKVIIIGIIAIAIIALTLIGISVYKHISNKLYSGDGIYYSQQTSDIYLKFNKDNTFKFSRKLDDNTEQISNGKWSENNNKVTLTFDEGGSHVFIRTEDGYLYREDKVFRGKTNDEKLWNNRFVMEKDGEDIEEIWFLNDGTVDYKVIGDSKMSHGTYTRVDDVLIVRYNKNPEIPVRFLVLDNGITREFYHREKPENVAK